jgi:hypothetical protein
LKNGVLLRDADGNEVVEILCNQDRAKKILELTAQLCPEACPVFTITSTCRDNAPVSLQVARPENYRFCEVPTLGAARANPICYRSAVLDKPCWSFARTASAFVFE